MLYNLAPDCFVRGRTLTGHSIETHDNVKTAKACLDEYCLPNTKCKSFVYNMDQNQCSLKSYMPQDISELQNDRAGIFAPRICDPGCL